MPPKIKYTKEKIIKASLDLIRAEGMDALTARSLSKKLGSSVVPIFTFFKNMNELQEEIIINIKKVYSQYVQEGLKESLAFKGVGKQYILFAKQEPKFFQILFMSEKKNSTMENFLSLMDDYYEEILNTLQTTYQLEYSLAKKLYIHMLFYTHGIASLCATKVLILEEAEISDILTEAFTAIMKEMKVNKND